jgi:hypothetical protein
VTRRKFGHSEEFFGVPIVPYHSLMLTDSPPRKNRQGFLESDRIKTLDLPPNGHLLDIVKRLESAMKSDSIRDIRSACANFLTTASDFYKVPNCGIRVLTARPLRVRENWSTELFGDYHPDAMLIRVWMRTAVRKEVTSFGTFLSTLTHEFVHHLDFKHFGFADSWHTRGFYARAAALYPHARGTPLKRLVWVRMGDRWRIDWVRTNRGRCYPSIGAKLGAIFCMLNRFAVTLIAVFISLHAAGAQQTSPEQDAKSTPGQAQTIFDFHNGLWVNLHHFLYMAAQASSGRVGHPQGDTADAEELTKLSESEQKDWNAARSYYASSLVHRDLLMDSGMEKIKNELEDEESSDLKNADIPPELKSVLLSAAPVYRKHWWPRHEMLNGDWISQLEPLVGRYGASLSQSLAKIYDVPWPQQPIRVDVVAYANWAGAYTTLYLTRATISSLNSANQGTAALEIVFHESSHAMMTRLMSDIDAAQKSATEQHSREYGRDFGTKYFSILLVNWLLS